MLSPEGLKILFLRGKTRFQTHELEAQPSKCIVSGQHRLPHNKGPLMDTKKRAVNTAKKERNSLVFLE